MKQLVDIGEAGKAAGKIVAVGEFGLDWDRTRKQELMCMHTLQKQYTADTLFFSIWEACELAGVTYARGKPGL